MARKFVKRPPSRSAKSKAPRKGEGEKEAQYARFLAATREAGVSDDPNAFDKALKKIISAPKP
jgi:hypothetical protein